MSACVRCWHVQHDLNCPQGGCMCPGSLSAHFMEHVLESRLAIAVEALRDIASEPGESASFGLGARCKRMAEKALALVP